MDHIGSQLGGEWLELSRVRSRCREVAEEGAHVRIDTNRLSAWGAEIPAEHLVLPRMDRSSHYLERGADTVAFFLTLNAVNFGSGYFPALRKRPGQSGYYSIAASLNAYFRAHGPLSPGRLAGITAADCAEIFGQSLSDAAVAELMTLFAQALNELGRTVLTRYGGRFLCLVEEAAGSAEKLVALLAEIPLFNDGSLYRGRWVPFLKRAQLTAVDLFVAFGGQGPGHFTDIDRLTLCADNLVPHVLRHDGVLRYDRSLAERIEKGDLIDAGSPEEVEIRACAVHAGELLVAALRPRVPAINAMLLDNYLWHIGHQPEYRKEPRHLTRTGFY